MAGFVFVSYSDADRGYVERLTQYLGGHGIAVWSDAIGAAPDPRAQAAVHDCAAVLAVLSPTYVESFTGELVPPGKSVLPVLLADCEPPGALATVAPEDVRGGRLPSGSFVERVRTLTGVPGAVTGLFPSVSPRRHAAPEPPSAPAAAPAPAPAVATPVMAAPAPAAVPVAAGPVAASVGAAPALVAEPPAAPPPLAQPSLAQPSLAPPAPMQRAAPAPPVTPPPTTAAPAAPSPPPAQPRRRPWRALAIVGSAVLVLLIVGGGYLLARGDGAAPGTSTPVPEGAPRPVTTLTVTDSEGGVGLDQRLHYSFTAPASEDPIVRYDWEYTGDDTSDATSTTTAGYLSGLTNGEQYPVRVRACAAQDACGEWSTPQSARPYGPVLAPTATATRSGDRRILLSWTPPALNGRELSTLEVRVDFGEWEQVPAVEGTRTVGNGPSQSHTVEVRAVDTAGQTGPLTTASATTAGSSVTVNYVSATTVGATLHNFAADTPISCLIVASSGVGGINVTTDANGDATGQGGIPAGAIGEVTVTCDGVTGARNPWAP